MDDDDYEDDYDDRKRTPEELILTYVRLMQRDVSSIRTMVAIWFLLSMAAVALVVGIQLDQ